MILECVETVEQKWFLSNQNESGMCRNCGFKHKQHQTAAHVLDFQFFIIRAVDIF